MNTRLLKLAAGAFLALGASLAQATSPTVIDFNSATGSFSSYAEDGYDLLSLSRRRAGVGRFDDDTLTTRGFTFTSAATGTPFDLVSLDLGNAGRQRGGSIELFYTLSGSSHVYEETLRLDRHRGLQTFTPSLEDVTSFTLVGRNSLQFQVDNINVTPFEQDVVTAVVPEPAPVALLLAGLGVLGVATRRRQG